MRVNNGNSTNGDESTPVGHFPGGAASDRFYESANAAGAANGLEGSTSAVGNSQAVVKRSPFQAVNYIIALVGTYPSRS